MLDLVERVRTHFADGCFACGRQNPRGLGIDGFTVDGDRIHAGFRPHPEHRGLVSQLHGGLSATALDEIMVWSGILLAGVLSVTGTMSLRYHDPVPSEGDLLLTGWIEERRGKRLRLAGTLTDRTTPDRPHVSATGLYVTTTTVEALLA